eukprot:TRINITY_DN11477_c0_g2_i2.p1 TRINITY_DN11477_c0_g2~~TRINITY_DN11477_c0_g2_i2.p1  ORF type:complete len:119 (+),score=8.09 TRINITY_DN11477_c0_g2_i2:130-486(+)
MIKCSKGSTQRIFNAMINGVYGYYIAKFLLSFLQSTEMVNVEVYNSQQVEAGKKKPISVLSLLYKIESDVVSIKAQSYLNFFPQEQTVNKSKMHVENARDKLATGAIMLLDVFFFSLY